MHFLHFWLASTRNLITFNPRYKIEYQLPGRPSYDPGLVAVLLHLPPNHHVNPSKLTPYTKPIEHTDSHRHSGPPLPRRRQCDLGTILMDQECCEEC